MILRNSVIWSAVLSFMLHAAIAQAGQVNGTTTPRRAATAKLSKTDAELDRLRANALAKMKESRSKYDQLLQLYEAEKARLNEEFEKRRELYQQGLIARSDVIPVQQALILAIKNIMDVNRWILEDDIAITELTLRGELRRLPGLARGGYSETDALIRFNGGAPWSLAEASKIERFFSEMFGRALPVSAFGQSPAHDQLRFDHRHAMDVALHPDSVEGRSLMSFLRRSGIPFIAFRSRIPGSSTGAHIHVGEPSTRN